MPQKLYITTPIYYVSAAPSIGSMYTTLIADILARFHRQRGTDVFFLTGTDEHGQKLEKSAHEKGLSPQKYVDEIAKKYQKTWELLNFQHDFFIRTTDEEHMAFVKEFFQKCCSQGDIYEGVYTGLYCVDCEEFLTKDKLVDGKCSWHHKKPIPIKEKNYFFALTKYKNFLLDYYKHHPDFVVPETQRNYVLDFIENDLFDVPVTRKNVLWGTPVPFDKTQTIYVWFDALLNYLSIFSYNKFKEKNFWPADVHLVGKEILRFHGALWPAMLKSAGYPLPKQIYAHSHITVDKVKMSKSLDNIVYPQELVNTFGVDGARYITSSLLPYSSDGNFSWKSAAEKYNAELANNLGNLLNRIIVLNKKHNIEIDPHFTTGNQDVTKKVEQVVTTFESKIKQFRIAEAQTVLNELASFSNKFLDKAAPWKKEQPETDRIETLQSLSFVLYKLLWLSEPFIPGASARGINALKTSQPTILFPKIQDLKHIGSTPVNSPVAA